MAVQEQHYLDLQGLQTYDALIKGVIPQPDDVTITTDSTTGKLKTVAPYFSNETVVFPK